MKKEWSLSPDDPVMCAWAYRYLKKRFDKVERRFIDDDYSASFRFMENRSSEEARKLLREEMQRAWRQKMYKEREKKKGKMPCSFILSKLALKNLDILAKGLNSSLNDTLERVINETYHEDKERRKQARQKSPFKMMNQ